MAKFQVSLIKEKETEKLFVIDTNSSRENVIEIVCNNDMIIIQLKDGLPLDIGQKIEITREI